MKIDHQELQSVAAVEQRFDVYGPIHKALRAFMADTLVMLGRVDLDDGPARQRACAQVADLADFCIGHLQHENTFVHPALQARAPGVAAKVAHEHEEHQREIAQLRAHAQALEAAAPAQRAASGHALYRELALFVGDNLVHMHAEETGHNAALWAHYSDAELLALHDALLASIPPQEMMLAARWMLPALRPAERLAVLQDMRAKAPPPAFEAVIATIRPHLDDCAWASVARGLGLPVAGGLAV